MNPGDAHFAADERRSVGRRRAAATVAPMRGPVWTLGLVALALSFGWSSGVAHADTPVASISDATPALDERVDVEMICVPDDDGAPRQPTFELLAPGGSTSIDPEPGSVSTDGSTVRASWRLETPGTHQLVVSCESSAVYDLDVGATDTTGGGRRDVTDAGGAAGTSAPRGTLGSGGGTATGTAPSSGGGTLPATGAADGWSTGSVLALVAIAVGCICVLLTRRRSAD